jgi:hypothetical protein
MIKDDFGDDQEIELDLSNEDRLKEYASALHKTKHYESELEVLRSQLAAREKKEQELQAKYGKYLTAATPEEIAEMALSEKGGLEAVVSQRLKEREEFNKLPEDQQKDLIRKQEERAQQLKIEKLQKELDDRMKKIQQGEDTIRKESEMALYRQATSKYCPVVTDNPDLKKVHEIIWKEAHNEITQLKSTGVMVTQAVVEQKFQKAYMNNKNLVSSVKGAGKNNSIVDATAAATSGAVTKTSSAPVSTVDEGATLTRWYNLMLSGKGGEVLREIATNPRELQPLHGKLAAMFKR